MATKSVNVAKNLGDWTFQNSHVERDMDKSALEAVHPDDTMVFAGPIRLTSTPGSVDGDAAPGAQGASGKILPIGMLQQISFQQGKPTQPLMTIGGGRAFFTSGKASTSWSAARLFVNGRSFLRALYFNALNAGVDVTKFDDPAGDLPGTANAAAAGEPSTASAGTGSKDSGSPKYVVNLDSELFYLPFGMGCLFRNKSRVICGSFYAESCMINSWATAINAGQSQIMEQVSGVADRLLPWKVTAVTDPTDADLRAINTAVSFIA